MPTQFEYDCVKAIFDLHDLGRPMAKENCPLADALVAKGYALPGPRDKFGRPTIELKPNGFVEAVADLSVQVTKEARDHLGPFAEEDEVSKLAHKMMCDGLDEPY